MNKKVRIFGTFGPCSHTKEQLIGLIQAGMTGIRLNLSHSSLSQARSWIESLRFAEKETQKKVELLIDMKGPELRVGILNEPKHLLCGDIIKLPTEIPVPSIVVENGQKGDRLLIDDGKILAEVKKNTGDYLECEIILGGKLFSNKSIAIEHKELLQAPISQEDIENIQKIKEFGVDSVMQPFVKDAKDLIALRKVFDEYNVHPRIYAKIESESGFSNLRSLFPYCDEIVIARGDLGNAVGIERLPIVQHEIETLCKKEGKPYMVVTQMLDSMVERAVPTRAEANDVFHAVYDGASSIMLTGEVANGKYPLRAMQVFANIVDNTLEYKSLEEAL